MNQGVDLAAVDLGGLTRSESEPPGAHDGKDRLLILQNNFTAT